MEEAAAETRRRIAEGSVQREDFDNLFRIGAAHAIMANHEEQVVVEPQVDYNKRFL